MSTITYGLRADYAGTVVQYDTEEDKQAGNGTEVPVFSGGIVAAGAVDVDVRELLEDPEHGDTGTIVVAETATALVNALDQYPALKRLETDAEPAEEAITDLDTLNVGDLRREAGREDLEAYGGLKRDELLRAVKVRRAVKAELAAHPSSDELIALNALTDARALLDATADRQEA